MNVLIQTLAAAALPLLAAVPAPSSAATQDMEILGWVEYAKLPAVDLEMKAKLDTGAETSSLDARIVSSGARTLQRGTGATTRAR